MSTHLAPTSTGPAAGGRPATAGRPLAGVPFAKGHGTRNDFVILPDPDGRLPLTAEVVAALCDRRAGIGGDGLLRVVRSAAHPDATAQADRAGWFMDYWNADGSYAEMCGNGLRVFARYLVETGLVGTGPGPTRIVVGTRSGPRTAEVRPEAVTVDLGLPALLADTAATVAGTRYPGVAADAGNPHLVCLLPAGATDLLGTLDLTRAPAIDPAVFPAGANIEFVQPAAPVPGADLHVRMRVHERGAGETASCGSGACAAAVAVLRAAGRSAGTVALDVPGGRLTLTVTADTCQLAGPAVIVATGTLA